MLEWQVINYARNPIQGFVYTRQALCQLNYSPTPSLSFERKQYKIMKRVLFRDRRDSSVARSMHRSCKGPHTCVGWFILVCNSNSRGVLGFLFFFFKIYFINICKYTVAVFRHSRRGSRCGWLWATMWLLGFELWTFGRAVGCFYPLSHLTSPLFLFSMLM